MTKFCHIGVLGVYDSLYNKWTPKRQYVSYRVCSLEKYVDNDGFNESSQLEQATIQVGGKRYNLNFSKITKNWSSKSIFKKRKIEAIFIGL